MPADNVPDVTAQSGAVDAKLTIPVSLATDWVSLRDTPATADNGGSAVTNPGNVLDTVSPRLGMDRAGTTVQIRLQYPAGASISTAPVVQLFGIDRNGVPQRLTDADGNHELTLSAASSDPTDGTSKWTEAKEVDAQANFQVMVAVKTALAGTGISGAKLLARIK